MVPVVRAAIAVLSTALEVEVTVFIAAAVIILAVTAVTTVPVLVTALAVGRAVLFANAAIDVLRGFPVVPCLLASTSLHLVGAGAVLAFKATGEVASLIALPNIWATVAEHSIRIVALLGHSAIVGDVRVNPGHRDLSKRLALFALAARWRRRRSDLRRRRGL